MKERFAKLLLGEDVTGESKGVSTALALSNAITYLAGNTDLCKYLVEELMTDVNEKDEQENLSQF
ncbi:hypothetical protein P3L10_003553 [Capsicum annuum]